MTKPFKLGILIADEDEIEQIQLFNLEKLGIIFIMNTGMGLVNMSRSIPIFKQLNFDMLVNLGTCGSTSLSIGTICEPKYFYQSDMQIGTKLVFDPAKVNKEEVQNIAGKVQEDQVCFSSSSFITNDSAIVKLGYTGIFDMEAYGFVATCKFYDMPYTVIKVVSDNLNLSEHRQSSVLENNKQKIIELIENIYVTGCHAVS